VAERQLAHDGTTHEGVAESTRRLWRVEGESQGGGPLDLDRLIHERVRLGIVSALAVNGELSFSEMKEILHATDGNLISHARRLEEAGYIVCAKDTEGRAPRTEYSLTDLGREEFDAYLAHMEALIRAARNGNEGGGR
jgi:DNA-binding MarR family transcriptional regulator